MNVRSRIAVALFAAAGATGAVAQGSPVDVVEYYHAGLDHYFVSALPAEIAALDSGTLKGWVRTGLTFKAHDAPAAGTSPVCRFYIPPAQGDSHFYSASPAECAEVAAKFPAFSYESPSVMYVGLPDAATGACGGGWTPVYRLWNNRADSNHRYTTDRSVRADMLARGYVAEGYGPEGVAMCAPSAGASFDLAFTSGSLLLMPGDVRDVYVVVTPRNGFVSAVTLTIDGLPPGVTAKVEPPTVAAATTAAAARIRLTAAASVAPATADTILTVRGNGNGVTSSAAYPLGIAPAGDPIATRLRAMDEVGARFQQLRAQGLQGEALLQGVAAFMAAHPQYAKASWDAKGGTASGLLKDGVLHVVFANREAAPPGMVAVRPQPEPKAAGDPELPGTPKAHVMHALTNTFEPSNAVAQMRGYLKERGWKSWEGADGDASVRSLARVKGAGFFYINAHGGPGHNHLVDPTHPDYWLYIVLTSDPADGVPTPEIAALLNQGPRLAYGTAFSGLTVSVSGTDIPISARYYAFTKYFVRDFMSFTDDSVVFINACSSADGDFATAFHDAGAAVYLGWFGTVTFNGAFTTPPYFVDRMVGANQYSLKESPPQRPFPFDLVLADMKKKGLDQDGNGPNSTWLSVSRKSASSNPIFAPSIRYVTVDEWEGELTLTGDFGSPTPKVTVGGAELKLKQWSNSKIVTEIPFSGAGSSGDVIVEVQGIRSNARQLTKWTIPLAYQWLDWHHTPGLKIEGDGKVIFRADVGGYRLEPAEKPRYVVRGGVSNRESWLKLKASGTYSDGICTETASGTEEFYSPARLGALLSTVLQSYFRVDTEQRRASVGLELGGIDLAITYMRSGKDCVTAGGPHQMTPSIPDPEGWMEFPGDQSEDPDTLLLPATHFTVDKNFTFPAIVRKGDGYGDAGLRVSWPAVSAESPPRDTSDAGK